MKNIKNNFIINPGIIFKLKIKPQCTYWVKVKNVHVVKSKKKKINVIVQK